MEKNVFCLSVLETESESLKSVGKDVRRGVEIGKQMARLSLQPSVIFSVTETENWNFTSTKSD